MDGRSDEFLKTLALGLLENTAARNQSEQVQTDLKTVQRFYRLEAQRLWRMKNKLAVNTPTVTQTQRDLLKIRYRHQFIK